MCESVRGCTRYRWHTYALKSGANIVRFASRRCQARRGDARRGEAFHKSVCRRICGSADCASENPGQKLDVRAVDFASHVFADLIINRQHCAMEFVLVEMLEYFIYTHKAKMYAAQRDIQL